MIFCSKVVGNKFNQFTDLIEQIESNEKAQGHVQAFDENIRDAVLQKSKECLALDQLGLNRYCCRRMILTHVDLITKLLNYNIYEFQEN